MPLDTYTAAYLTKLAAKPPIHSLSPAAARLQMAAGPFSISETARALVARIEDRVIPGPAGDLPIRIYTPEGTGPFPILVYFHGGGFILGDCDTHDPVCCELSHGAKCLTVSVDYRLAPEHKFPAGVEDCFAATRWVAENAMALGGDPSRIAVGGDSAGGNLSAVVALMARDEGGPPLVFQLLIYPIVAQEETASRKELKAFFDDKMMEWFNGYYFNSQDEWLDWRASPLLAKDFTGLPPALIITVEYDPLRDEGEAYAKKLEAAGVPVTCTCYDSTIHGFVSYYQLIKQGKVALDECVRELGKAFGTSAIRNYSG